MDPSKYAVHSMLHRGDRSTVYRAVRIQDDRPVLLKCALYGPPAERLRSLQHELEVLRCLQIPGIIRAFRA